MEQINLKEINREIGKEVHDFLRDGRSTDLDPLKVSAVLTKIVDKINRIFFILDQLEDRTKRIQRKTKKIAKKIV
jgi:hypothetical protein